MTAHSESNQHASVHANMSASESALRRTILDDRARLTFSLSTYVVLRQLELEFTLHDDIVVGTDFDGETFILVAECPDTPEKTWEVRAIVLTFDPGSTMIQGASIADGTEGIPVA